LEIHEIGQFYGERFGWRMFDARFLTKEVKVYLDDEEAFVEHVMSSGYDYLVEVGCGYGRYLDWAMSRGYSYAGLDIVPWMVDIGRVRAENARASYGDQRCDVLINPAESLEDAIKKLEKDSPDAKFLVFFPFNSLGNISSLSQALESIEAVGVDFIVSTFKTDAKPTNYRLDYYRNCGYENLNSRLMRQGILIVSDEGFHAFAYNRDWLITMLQKHGFELTSSHEDGKIGRILYFRYENRRELSPTARDHFEAIVHVVDAGKDSASEKLNQSANLHRMDEYKTTVTVIGSSTLSCILPERLNKGCLIHINAELMMSGNQMQYHDLSALVESSIEVESGFETVVRLTRSGWTEKVGLRKASR